MPDSHSWGNYKENSVEYSFFLVEFLRIQKQNEPADPYSLAAALANLHMKSQYPTGKFGFHTPTCHARNIQAVDFWTDSWCELSTEHLSRILSHAKVGFTWPVFARLGKFVMSKAVPALLLLLQTEGRSIKPCFVHGDCWDGNTAMADDSRVLSLMLLPSMLTTNMMWAIGDHPDMSLATRPT